MESGEGAFERRVRLLSASRHILYDVELISLWASNCSKEWCTGRPAKRVFCKAFSVAFISKLMLTRGCIREDVASWDDWLRTRSWEWRHPMALRRPSGVRGRRKFGGAWWLIPSGFPGPFGKD